MSARWSLLCAGLLLWVMPGTAGAQLSVVTARDEAGDVAAVELVSLRSLDDIRADLELATRALAMAETDIMACRGELQRCEADVDIQRSRIDITKTELRLARSQRREVERQNLEQRRRVQEAEKELLERVEDVVRARLKFSEARLDWAQAAVAAYGLELELVEKNQELAALEERVSDAAPPDWLGEGLDDLRKQALDAMETASEREIRVARERRSFIRAQLRVLDAQRKLTERLAEST